MFFHVHRTTSKLLRRQWIDRTFYVVHVKDKSLHQKSKLLILMLNIYILSAVALDETNISGCLHFSILNIEISCDLDRASRRSNVNVSQ